MTRLIIRPEAESDLREAYEWYEAQREGLGLSLLLSMDAGLDFIRRFPEAPARVSRDYRRHLIKRFPYGIFYRVEGETLVVAAIFHASRDPKNWQRRLK